MVLHKTKGRRLQLVAYSIVIAAFVISIAFPIVLQFTEPFAAPTAVHSEMIVNEGHLAQGTSLLLSPQVFWGSALSVESQYPIGSILVSVFILISSIPFQYAMFFPLVAIGNIIYFVLARYILSSISNNKGLVWFFSALFYLYFVVSSSAAGAVGRASLGIMFLAFFIYVYLRFAREIKVPSSQSRHFGSVVILLLLVLAIGFEYYFATIDIIALMMLIIIFTTLAKSALPRKRPWLECSILVIAIFLFLGTTAMVEQIQITTITRMFSSFVQYIGSMVGLLGIKLDWLNTAPTLWNINLVRFDPITSFGSRVLLIAQYSSIIATIACIFAYRPRKGQRSPKDVVWLFCVFILFSSVGELGYLTAGPYSPLRLLFNFGPIVTLSVVIGVIPESNKIGKLKFDKLKPAIAVLVVLLFSISIWGQLRVATTYGIGDAKPFAYDNVYPFSIFICTHTTNEKPLVLASDENYAATVFFISSLNNKTASVIAEPLLGDAITLNEAVATGDSQVFVSAMQYRQIQYLLIISDGKPIYGDVWGYVINNPKADTISQLQFALIYDDGQAQLFQVFPGSGS